MRQGNCIYLDYNATTPIDPQVLSVMIECFGDSFGNASSKNHYYGKQSQELLLNAKTQIASLINCRDEEIIFTSGSTEGINLALKGIALTNTVSNPHIITVNTEHKAVLDTCIYLESIGIRVSYLEVNEQGVIDLKELEKEICGDTVLVAVMLANNETGIIQPLEEISQITNKYSIPLFTDATQAVGKIVVDIEKLGVDLMAFSSHKLYGPKGVGALFVKSGLNLVPLIHGGGQQKGMRGGTYNIPSIVGFSEACTLAKKNMEKESVQIAELRDKLEIGLSKISKTDINSGNVLRLPNTSNVIHYGLDANTFVNLIGQEIALSTGSACTSAVVEPSHVLQAMGLSDDEANSSIRYSLGRFTTEGQIDDLLEILSEKLKAGYF